MKSENDQISKKEILDLQFTVNTLDYKGFAEFLWEDGEETLFRVEFVSVKFHNKSNGIFSWRKGKNAPFTDVWTYVSESGNIPESFEKEVCWAIQESLKKNN